MKGLILLVVVGAAFFAGDALACPSCVDPREANTNAFLGSTVALSLIPLAFIFSVVAWVVKNERAANRAAADEAAAAALPVVPPAE